MYLKSIEMQGFKSFADKIVLEFNEGVTGIVGPNGSGKSNIADAVRWVLGEQSAKQLRGSNMQDVIFSGTENRKAVSYAYVTLKLDNSDRSLALNYDEVIVSRRVYRSGESEYLLNGSSCRLKDVLELFYDTGIGKEGYSIIGQGQIDRILSGKPEERRELFDEAAGIVKFKKRKAVAQKRLENEHLNLVRVKDVLAEMEKQVGPLSRQSEKARQYLLWKEECRQYDLFLFAEDQNKNQAKITETEEKKRILEHDLSEKKQRADAIRTRYEAVINDSRVLEEQMMSVQSELSSSCVESENLEGQIRLLQEQILHLRTGNEEKQRRLAEMRESLKRNSEEQQTNETEQKKLKESSLELMDSSEQLRELIQDLDRQISEQNSQLSKKQSELIDTLNRIAGLKAQDQRYEALTEQSLKRREEIEEKLRTSKAEKEDQEKEQAELEQVLLHTEEEGKRLSDQEKELTSKEQELVALREEGRQQVALASQQYERTHSQWESLRNIAERYEGFGGSTRHIMDSRSRFPGVLGTVSDLIRTDKKYELAVETALGASIQNIVTDNETTAKECIQYLKENKYGRSTFLPLESIQKKEFTNKEVLKEKGVLGLGSSLIKAPDNMPSLPSYLLGNVLVVEDMDRGLQIARKYHYDFRIVTLEGDQLNRGGSLTGGAFKNSSNLLGRKRELEELQTACRKWDKTLSEKKKKLEETGTSLSEVRNNRDEVRRQLTGLEILKREKEARKQALLDRVRDKTLGSMDLEQELSRLNGQSEEAGNKQNEIISQVEKLENVRARIQKETDDCRQKLLQLQEQKDRTQADLNEQTAKLAAASQKNRFLSETQERLLEEKNRMQTEAEECREGLGAADGSAEEKEKEINRLSGEITEKKEKQRILQNQVDEFGRTSQEYKDRQKNFLQEKDALTDEIMRLDQEDMRLDHQKEKLEETMEAQASYLWSEYEVTPSEALTYSGNNRAECPLSSSELRKKMQQLRTDMKNLGPVNINAIDDYKELSERYTFMKTQHDDLVHAEESLQKVITELDEGMKRQFTEKFEEIRKEFDKVFQELFGGGKGTLELMDPENLLECGIQIIAQPPGKKLINMMQMSGGEKALTAISILFAIQNLKPSPFCLLDEIEAALDEVNVSRYAEYLKKLTSHTQFITITHRRGTMLAADRLYGITMQEKGISTLVSVNLT